MHSLNDEDIIEEMQRCKSAEVQDIQSKYLAKKSEVVQQTARDFPFDQPYKVKESFVPTAALLGSLVAIRDYYDDGTVGVAILRPGNGIGALSPQAIPHKIDPQGLEVYTPRAG